MNFRQLVGFACCSGLLAACGGDEVGTGSADASAAADASVSDSSVADAVGSSSDASASDGSNANDGKADALVDAAVESSVPLLANGTTCSQGGACQSGNCVDGVCCNSRCDGVCESCLASSTGGTTGTCAPVSAMTDPDNECSGSGCETETCSGAVGCGAKEAGTSCRPSVGDCDVAETCDGTRNVCPTDTVLPRTTVCRAASDACDAAESCDGTTGVCPANQLAASGTPCRAAAGTCDAVETCDGTNATCPVDKFLASGSSCGGGFTCPGTRPVCPTCAGDSGCVNICMSEAYCVLGKRAFLTKTTYNGNLGGLSGADAKCQAEAIAAGFQYQYKAWLGSATVTAASRMTQSTGKYYLQNGTVLADDWADLTDGSLDAAFAVYPDGTTPASPVFPWTYASDSGGAPGSANHCSNWTSTSGSGFAGGSDQTGTSWSTWQMTSCATPSPLWCVQQ